MFSTSTKLPSLIASCFSALTLKASTTRSGALVRHAPLLNRREAVGKVRHCHGDLHLRNIYLSGRTPQLFDCIFVAIPEAEVFHLHLNAMSSIMLRLRAEMNVEVDQGVAWHEASPGSAA